MEYNNFDIFSRSNDQLKGLVDMHLEAYQARRADALSAQVKPEQKACMESFIKRIELQNALYPDEVDSLEVILQKYLKNGTLIGNQYLLLKEILEKRVRFCKARANYENATGDKY